MVEVLFFNNCHLNRFDIEIQKGFVNIKEKS